MSRFDSRRYLFSPILCTVRFNQKYYLNLIVLCFRSSKTHPGPRPGPIVKGAKASTPPLSPKKGRRLFDRSDRANNSPRALSLGGAGGGTKRRLETSRLAERQTQTHAMPNKPSSSGGIRINTCGHTGRE